MPEGYAGGVWIIFEFSLLFMKLPAIRRCVVVESLRAACSFKDYYSPFICLGTKQRTPSPSLVAFYETSGKVWAVCIFCVALLAKPSIIIYERVGNR